MMEPGVAEWSALMTRVTEAIEAFHAAYRFDCPPAMAPKAASLLSDLRDVLTDTEKKVSHDNAH